MDKRFIAIGIAFLLVGLLIGYVWGYKDGVEWAVNTGFEFLKAQGIALDVDGIKLADAIYWYKEKIDNYLH